MSDGRSASSGAPVVEQSKNTETPPDTIGVIKPPPDVRLLVDKTAGHVAKNGRKFEENIKALNQAKFAFLNVGHPYHLYYAKKVDELVLQIHLDSKAEGGEPAATPATTATPAAPTARTAPATAEQNHPQKEQAKEHVAGSQTSQSLQAQEEKETENVKDNADGDHETVAISSAPKLDPTAEAFKKDRQGKPPPELLFTVDHPIGSLSQYKIDLVKLVAKHGAVQGRKFISSIAAREITNPEFSFLRVSDPHHGYFQAMLDAYKKVLDWEETLRQVSNAFGEKLSVLDRAVHRIEHSRQLEEEAKAKEKQTTEDVIAFHQIDWHDFALVGTIEFEEEEEESKTASTPQGSHSKAGQSKLAGSAGSNGAGKTGNVARDDDDDDDVMDLESDEEEIQIQQNYVPKVATGDTRSSTVALPDGRQVSTKDLNEHMRVEMLDPKWKEQQQKFQERQKTTALVEKDVSKHLDRMAAHQPAVFGVSDQAAEEARQEAKRKRADAGLVWDGSTSSAVEVQLASRQRRHEGGANQDASQTPAIDYNIGPAGATPTVPPPSKVARVSKSHQGQQPLRPPAPPPPPPQQAAPPPLPPPPPPKQT